MYLGVRGELSRLCSGAWRGCRVDLGAGGGLVQSVSMASGVWREGLVDDTRDITGGVGILS